MVRRVLITAGAVFACVGAVGLGQPGMASGNFKFLLAMAVFVAGGFGARLLDGGKGAVGVGDLIYLMVGPLVLGWVYGRAVEPGKRICFAPTRRTQDRRSTTSVGSRGELTACPLHPVSGKHSERRQA
jgi:hypothetical protein